ncbi:MAG: hypothetical protein JWO46_1794 [Nocardioidaceae bacterium]|nr:hypothetical protein [Nocardioidaceae bacterium]
MSAVWEFCRDANQYLGIVTAIAVMWRLVPLLLDANRRSSWPLLHRVLVFATTAGYAGAAAWGATYYSGTTAAAGPVSAATTLLHLALIVLCLFWPHPTRITSLEEVDDDY